MAYQDDLLRQAFQLANKERVKPKQASLRRAVSTAYYALFHLLISEAVANWRQPTLQTALGRAFDHGVMKAASNRLQDTHKFPFTGVDPQIATSLRFVARAFALLQENRHVADYDNGTLWSKTDAMTEVKLAQNAFQTWKTIRHEPIAQAYLVSLIVKKRD